VKRSLHLEDLAVRDRILAGEREVAERFFERHVDALFEFVCYRVGRNRALTEDVVQDTLLVAVERMASFDARSSLHTWLCGIARNKIREHRRRRGPVALEDVLESTDPEIDAILAEIEEQELPSDVLEARETRELVGAALSSLPPDYREALLGKYVDELSLAQMGERNGRGTKATESLLARARIAFARVFTLLAGRREGLS
jgi:RNA polymerase sigma-70 factor (ECF subfamily)